MAKRADSSGSGRKCLGKKAWIISVDMGYGHQRAAYPLSDIACERVITANSDKVINVKEQKLWKKANAFYDWVSRATSVPFIGPIIFRIFDRLQYISPFYPFRDLSMPNYTVLYIERLIDKGLCRSVMEYIKKAKLPFVTTYPITALAANHYKLKDIYCVVTDTDINRSWIAKSPKKSRIIYLSPTKHTSKRLMQYGVPEDKVILTGFPLPKENLGGVGLKILKKDVGERLPNLDPNGHFIPKYKGLLKQYLGSRNVKHRSDHMLTLTFAIGGAGAQRDLAVRIMKSLKRRIVENRIKLYLVAGTRLETAQYLKEQIHSLGLDDEFNKGINIITALDKKSYFEEFNRVLRKTDILWTKPSELCFYAALGLPIIISPPVGAHEVYNRSWLEHHGFGIPQEDPDYTGEWLFDWINDGRLAQTAWKGFWDAPKYGTYNIEKLVFSKRKRIRLYE